MALKVAVDHEHLVATWVWTGPFPDFLVMLFDVLLKPRRDRVSQMVGHDPQRGHKPSARSQCNIFLESLRL